MVSTRQYATKFSVGETVLCYEPDTTKAKVLYESKILEVDFTKDEKGKKVPEYYIHFSGWNKSWDRWVMEDQVLEANEMNRLQMKKLHEEATSRLKNKKKRKSGFAGFQDTPQSSSDALFQVSHEHSSSPPMSPSVPCIEIEIPSSLKLKLEDDCYFIKRKKKLVRLPRSPCVLDILRKYLDHVENDLEANASSKIVNEVMDGLRIYFDFTLKSLLLYNFERDQYERVMRTTKEDEHQTDESLVEEIKKEPCVSIKPGKKETAKYKRTQSKRHSDNSPPEKKSSDRVLRRRPKRQKMDTSPQQSNSNGVRESKEKRFDTSNEEKIPVKKNPRDVPSETTSKNTTKKETKALMYSSPCEVYGVEHLLRLFVKLPSLLAKTSFQEHKLSLLLNHLTQFLQYLSLRVNELFSPDVYQDSVL